MSEAFVVYSTLLFDIVDVWWHCGSPVDKIYQATNIEYSYLKRYWVINIKKIPKAYTPSTGMNQLVIITNKMISPHSAS